MHRAGSGGRVLDTARLELMIQFIRSNKFCILVLGVYLSSGSKYQASAARGMVMRQIMGGVKTVSSDLNMLGLVARVTLLPLTSSSVADAASLSVSLHNIIRHPCINH